jgi:hypothetical protein
MVESTNHGKGGRLKRAAPVAIRIMGMERHEEDL